MREYSDQQFKPSVAGEILLKMGYRSSNNDLLAFLSDELLQLDLKPAAIPNANPVAYQVDRDRFGMVITFNAEAHTTLRNYLEATFAAPTFQHERTCIFRATGRGVTAMLNRDGPDANIFLLIARDPAIAAEAAERVCEAIQQVVHEELAETLQMAADVLRDLEEIEGTDSAD